MRAIIFKIAAVAALCSAMLTACGEKNAEPAVANAHHSDCTMHTDSKGLQNPDSASISYANGTLHVTHHNLLVNCGSAKPESVINVRATVRGNAIDIWEEEDPDTELERCMCEVDNEFDITGISQGTYTLTFHNWYPQAQSTTVTL